MSFAGGHLCLLLYGWFLDVLYNQGFYFEPCVVFFVLSVVIPLVIILKQGPSVWRQLT